MYFHSVHGKNITLSADSSQARRVSGFCQGITFSNNPLTQLQRITFLVGSDTTLMSVNNNNKCINQPLINTLGNVNNKQNMHKISSKKTMWNGNLRIGLTTKNPITLTLSDLPEFSYPTLLNTDGFWITVIKSSYLKNGNKLSIVLDKNNSLQLAVNYVVKAKLFADMLPTSPSTKLWLILDLYGATNLIQFLPSDDTPYEIRARGLEAVNNFHSACLLGGSKAIYKTRLLILGQKKIGKTCLKQSLVNYKDKNTKAQNKIKLQMSASFRVNVDSSTSSWRLKPINRYELNDMENKSRRYHSSHNLNYRSNENLDKIDLVSKLASDNKKLSLSNDYFRNLDSKNRSSSTSYLNDEDDCDDVYYADEDVIKFRRQMSYDAQLKEEEPGNTRENDFDASNLNQSINIDKNNFALSDFKKLKETSASSSSSSMEDSEFSDDDENLYSIDECDNGGPAGSGDVLKEIDCDEAQLKKDPTGYYYKRIAINIYQELFSTKLYEKLWPSNTTTGTESINGYDANGNLSINVPLVPSSITHVNNFSESFFEKLALAEFETSIYNQLSCRSILYSFYEKIVTSEMKLIRNKCVNTILVNPKIKNSNSSTEQVNGTMPFISSNYKSLNKKLSLNILEFGGQANEIFLSSRAVYLVCFDLSKDLNELANDENDNSGRNIELSNLDYLDFLFKSIHSHTAKIIDISSNLGPNSLSNSQPNNIMNTVEIENGKTITFKHATLSPPIIIVGTNRNKLSNIPNQNDRIRQKFDAIKEFVCNKVYANQIVEPYFAVDTAEAAIYSPNETKKSESVNCSNDDTEELRRVIELVALNEPYMGEQLPVKWMEFEKSLEKLKNKGLFYASLSQICEIAHEKNIKTQEELTTCLNFYHDLGTIIYFGNANDIFLRNTIILRPQKLVDIFNMVLNAKMPTSFSKIKNTVTFHENGEINQTVYLRQSHLGQLNNIKWTELWEDFDKRGILNDNLLDVLWKKVIDQKPGLLGLMKKFDFICEKALKGNNLELLNREYLVPSRACIIYNPEIDDRTIQNSRRKEKINPAYSDYYDYDDENFEYEEINDKAVYKMKDINRFNLSNIPIIEFFYDFCGFLPESLFHRIITRTARWIQMKTLNTNKTEMFLYYRKARFNLDEKHDFILEMAPLKYARIKVQILRLNTSTNGYVSEINSPEPNACAKVRNFMETTLIDLRNLWMKRLMFNACVQCSCEKKCNLHQLEKCTHLDCMHFLNLDECLTNNIVTCEYRRVKTYIYKSWFPAQNISLHKGPVLLAVKSYTDKNMFYDENSLPNWIKNVAKLLQVNSKDKENKDNQIVSVHNENDWNALARLLGYNKSKIANFNRSSNPALQLICDWIMSSDNTNLTIEFLLNYLEQIKREDCINIINNEREKEIVNSSVFISYQWDSQEEVIKIKDHLEKAGFNCFMDVGQIGGGNLLYQRIDQAIRNAKVVIACITPKFVVSHFCNREMALADLLRKPIVPIMLTTTPWPPPGGMSLIFSQLVYVDYFGVGGHGGCGINADREQRNNEIVAMVSRHVNPSSYFLMNIDRITDNDNQKAIKKRTFFNSLKPDPSVQYYNRQNLFIDEVNNNINNQYFLNRQYNQSAVMSGNNLIMGSNLTQIRQEGSGGFANPNRMNGNSGNNNGNENNESSRCSICNLL